MHFAIIEISHNKQNLNHDFKRTRVNRKIIKITYSYVHRVETNNHH